MEKYSRISNDLPPVFRLGLATRGNTNPAAQDVHFALEQGINYWNWCGHEDGMSQAIRELGQRRSQVVVATQIGVDSWTAAAMQKEIDRTLNELATDWIDVVTLYYVESEAQWQQIIAPDGAWNALHEAQRDGKVKLIGLTTHQRDLAKAWALTDRLDLLMIRYNAAHRGAEHDVFPVTDRVGLPVVCFTCLRWGALLQHTSDDPSGFEVPPAPAWYRFVLTNPAVSVAIMAPHDRRELEENLTLLDDWRAATESDLELMRAHGDRVRHESGPFP